MPFYGFLAGFGVFMWVSGFAFVRGRLVAFGGVLGGLLEIW